METYISALDEKMWNDVIEALFDSHLTISIEREIYRIGWEGKNIY